MRLAACDSMPLAEPGFSIDLLSEIAMDVRVYGVPWRQSANATFTSCFGANQMRPLATLQACDIGKLHVMARLGRLNASRHFLCMARASCHAPHHPRRLELKT